MFAILVCTGMLLFLLAVLCYAPKWIKVIFFTALIGWICFTTSKLTAGIFSCVVGFYLIIRVLVFFGFGDKEDERHHSEKGTKFWE